jgi:uncharacterized protein YfaS (alpha-2-macroglobulin family)/tetratricopeptide (TPR) repeat protein
MRSALIAALLLAATTLATVGLAATADETYRDAEMALAERSFGTACDLYDQLVKDFPGDPRAEEAELKAAQCRIEMEEWDLAQERLEPFVEKHRDTLFAARGRRLLVQVYNGTWRVKDKWIRCERLLAEALDWLRGHADTPDARQELALALFALAEELRNALGGREERDPRVDRIRGLLNEALELDLSPETSAEAAYSLADLEANWGDEDTALKTWASVAERWPDTPWAPHSQSRLADRLTWDEKRVLEALAALRVVEARWPASQWAAEARDDIGRIVDPSVSLQCNQTAVPGSPVPGYLVCRNVRRVKLAAFSLDLTAAFRAGKGLWDTDELPRGAQVKTWTTEITDWQDHKVHREVLELPLTEAGVYGILATDAAGETESYAVVNVTSLVALQTVSPTREVVAWVADRLTGRAVEGAELTHRVTYWRSDDERTRTVAAVTTGANGLSRTALPADAEYGEVTTLVRHDGQVALTDGSQIYSGGYEATMQCVAYTDRPVYRPGQTVNYWAALRHLKDGELRNAPDETAVVTIVSPRGDTIRTERLTTNEFGTCHGEFELEDEPALGWYSLQVRGEEEASFGFRVEEYRKPEFEVAVEPASDDMVPGQKATATIKAEYYFGGPVRGAKVGYVVERRPYDPDYRHPRPYDWFIADDERYPGHGSRGVVARGEAVTDGDGAVSLSFDTIEDDEQDHAYTVRADVTDQSRRTVAGQAEVKVTRSSFRLFPETSQSLYHAADNVTVDLRALTPNEDPVQVAGQLQLYKLVPKKRTVERDGRRITEPYEEREPVLDAPLAFATDAGGNAHITFVPDREGWFEVEVSAPDPRREQPSKATVRFWAVNDRFDGDNLDYTNLVLITDRDVYEQGETARFLINAPEQDRDVLVAVTAGDLLETRVAHLNGSAYVLELPIRAAFVPGFTVDVAVVGRDVLYRESRRIAVPPTDRFLKVTVASDRPAYRPGDKGRFEVSAVDSAGKPADSEVCLAITDESVYYIQGEIGQPIEKAFYPPREAYVYWQSSWGYDHVWERAMEDGLESQVVAHWSGVGGLRYAKTRAAEGLGAGEGEGAPMPAAAPREKAAGGRALAQPTLRSAFADTAFWGPTLRTGPDGQASAEVEFPDNLTTWRATGRAITTDTRVGQARGSAKTTKDIIARLEVPRFLVQGDEATISTIAHNYLADAKDAQVELAVEGLEAPEAAPATVTLPAGGEARVDQRVRATTPGTALLTARVLTDVESDAMQLPVPVLTHGVEKFVWRAGQIAAEGGETFELPTERLREQDALTVEVTPSLAATLLAALPYLADYPYGCVEQTMNRFVPSVIVADTVKKLGLKPDERLADVPTKVERGLRKLTSQQNEDGSWGWWPGGRGDLYMTAYVVSGLLRAKAAGFGVDADVLERALNHVRERAKRERRLDTVAYCAYVLAQSGGKPGDLLDRAYAERDELNEHSRALLVLGLNYIKDDRAKVVLRNLVDYRTETDNGCHWGDDKGWCWRWSDDPIEATAASLQALLRLEPGSPLVRKTVWWLVTNRRGEHWKSTKDTALAIAGLSEYLLSSKELGAAYTASVFVNEKLVKSIEVTPDNALSVDGDVTVDRALLRDGANTLRLRKDGAGSLYYSLLATYFSTEEPITGARSVIAVDRRYFVVEDTVDEEQHLQTRRQPLSGPVPSGTQIEVELTLTSENDFDYVMFEDYKPAGCEPVDLHSGYLWTEGLGVYREFRDEKVAFFADFLPQGTHKLTYRLRAETPGDFHVLPNRGQGMYQPDLRALSDELRLSIR